MSLAFLSEAFSPHPTLAIPLDRTLGLSVLRTCSLRRLNDALCRGAVVLLASTLGPGWPLGQDPCSLLCHLLKVWGRAAFPKVGICFVSPSLPGDNQRLAESRKSCLPKTWQSASSGGKAGERGRRRKDARVRVWACVGQVSGATASTVVTTKQTERLLR